MFDILSTAMHDDQFMAEMDKFYVEVKAVDAMPVRKHIECPTYGQYTLEDFNEGGIECLEGEVVTLDTIVAYGVNYKNEGITSGLATLAFIKSLNDAKTSDDMEDWGYDDYED